MATNFQKHGLDTNFVQSLFGCHTERQTNMDDYDPQRLVEQLERELETNTTDLRTILPPMSIFHGTADQTVPYEVSEKYAASLQTIGVTTEYIAYEGWSHTDPILEAIMMADHRFHADLYDRLYQWTSSQSTAATTTAMQQQASASKRVIPLQLDDSIPECQPLCPTCLVQAARFCNPF
jgi:acetyl esterase/lipase